MSKKHREMGIPPGPPDVVILAGPNGAGKSTTAPALLKGLLAIDDFVNPDVIAEGLSGFAPESVAVEAADIMLRRIRALAEARASFGFETTLASRSYANWLRRWIARGYRVHLIFLWLSNVDLAVERVAQRVRLGGHAVPEETIRRRYRAGLCNFFRMYQPLAATWRLYDNSGAGEPRLVAAGQRTRTTRVADRATWRFIRETAR